HLANLESKVLEVNKAQPDLLVVVLNAQAYRLRLLP
ncbi:unnamed protein product, partial [marine sediment metagenome]